jgi:hypothetical protein
MRSSSAVLTDSSVRLWDLVFPAERALLGRTRAAYVHLDNLIAYSKRDRDAKVHAYLACWRPDETVLLFFLGGDLVNAAVLTPVGRFPVAISEAIKHLRAEPERSELAFHSASTEQLAAMFAASVQAPLDLGLDATSPKTVFDNVLARKWSGLLELISNGRVNYLSVKEGRFAGGMFADQRKDEDAKAYLTRMFSSKHPEPQPRLTVKAFAGLADMPLQAPPALVQLFRQYVWDLVDLADREMPGGGAAKRAEKIRLKLTTSHEALKSMGGVRGSLFADPIVEPAQIAGGVAAWTKDFLDELEVMHPRIAPQLLKEATREQRFQFAALGFFDRLPWKIEW